MLRVKTFGLSLGTPQNAIKRSEVSPSTGLPSENPCLGLKHVALPSGRRIRSSHENQSAHPKIVMSISFRFTHIQNILLPQNRCMPGSLHGVQHEIIHLQMLLEESLYAIYAV